MKKQTKHPDGLEIYQSKNKEYYWRYYKKGRIIAGSTEGYKRLNGLESNFASICGFSIIDFWDAEVRYKQDLKDAGKSISNRSKKG